MELTLKNRLSKYCENSSDPVLADKILGMILGHALGDALGAPSEFRPHQPYRKTLEPIKRNKMYSGRQECALGQVTDDTEMSMALLYSMASGKFSKDLAVLEYMEWANSGCPFMGKNTRNLLKGVKTLNGYVSRRKKFIEEISPESWTQSNGCLMRAYPLAFAPTENAKIDCDITNPAPICVEAVQLYCEAIRMLLRDEDMSSIDGYMVSTLSHGDLVNAYTDAKENKERNIREMRGWVAHAFYCGFWALLNFDNYKTAVDSVILHSVQGTMVGDTDTNAAIAGAMLGARYGLARMADETGVGALLNDLVGCNPDLGDCPRPKKYWMSLENILELARIAEKTMA